MPSLLLLCGEPQIDLLKFQEVAVLSPFRKDELAKKGLPCSSLFDFPIDNRFNRRLCVTIDRALHQEHEQNPKLKWAPLAFLHVQSPISIMVHRLTVILTQVNQLADGIVSFLMPLA